MSSIKNHLILRIILFIFLISYQHNNPFTENFDFIPYKSYIITCITSCCVGVILCVLFQRYCCNTSIIISKEKGHNENTKVKILEQLHLKINNIQENITIVKEEQEQLRTVFNEHKNDLQTISTILTNAIDNHNPELCIDICPVKHVQK